MYLPQLFWISYFSAVYGFYEKHDIIQVLNYDTFQEKVIKTSDYWIVQFCKPSEPKCIDFEKMYDSISKQYESYIYFGVVNLDSHAKIAKELSINTDAMMPTVVAFNDIPKTNPYKNTLYRKPDPFFPSGQHLQTPSGQVLFDWTPRELKRFIRKTMPSHVVTLTSTTFDEFFSNNITSQGNTMIALFSKKVEIASLYKGISNKFQHRRVVFAQIHEAEKSVMKKFKLESTPALLAITNEDVFKVFDTKEHDLQEYDDLVEFITPFLKDEPSPDEEAMSAQKDTTFLSASLFKEKVRDTHHACAVYFHKGDGKEEFDVTSDEWKKFNTKLQNKIGVAFAHAVDCTAEKSLCDEFGGPGLRIFPYSKGKSREKLLKQVSSANSLSDAMTLIEKSLPDDDVRVLTHAQQLQEFLMLAQQLKKVPMILLTQKHEIPSLFKSLQSELPEVSTFAVYINPDEQVKSHFSIQKLPTIATVIAKTEEEGQQGNFGVVHYNKKQLGPINFPNLFRFVHTVIAQVNPEKLQQIVPQETDAVGDSEVPYLTSDNFDGVCVKKGKLCAIGMLQGCEVNGTMDEKLTSQLGTMKEIAEKTAQDGAPIQFMWLDGICQSEFAETFDVQPFKLPTIAVFSPKKLRYATNTGSFNVESGHSFLKSVLGGRIGTVAIPQMPRLFDRNCATFHQQEIEDAVEDDLSDMDDMMQEILAEENRKKKELEDELKKEALEREIEEQKAKEEASKKDKKKKKKKKKKKVKATEKDEL